MSEKCECLFLVAVVALCLKADEELGVLVA